MALLVNTPFLTAETRVFAASFGYVGNDAIGTYVSLVAGKALAAAETAYSDEEERYQDDCLTDGDCQGKSVCDCLSPLWTSGEHAYRIGDLLDARELDEHGDALVAGNVVAVGGC